ncbi:MAG: phosphatidylinositol-specific phospholipase C/glycerophosphodiester phosphodiesterase family protein [Bacteroidetes bacterium]|nr:phosphatidylinositol-specific phospholipase C/glycerophosphodiester phosphodiesterase family protein [Bacteroidota bacterium]
MQLKLIIISFILFSINILVAQDCCLKNAHSHNDYKQQHPLTDALKNKFISIEADIFLINDQLIISHTYPLFKKHNTLEYLYLKPLLDSCDKHNGKVYEGCNESLTLLIEIKSDKEKTYPVLKKLLEKYQSILSKYENGTVIFKGVTVIITGKKPYSIMENEQIRLAFIDEDLLQIDKPYNKSLCPLASTKYANVLKWKGKGKFPNDEKNKLISLTAEVHLQGKKMRLWASPENKYVWSELLNCGVDLINTNELEKLHLFLTEEKK